MSDPLHPASRSRRRGVRGALRAPAVTLASLLSVGLCASLSLAQQDSSGGPHITSPTIEPLLRMGLALCLIGAAAWGLGVWARRRRIVRSGADHRIDVLALRSLGPRQRLALIEVGERRFLIGIGSDQIRPIADLSESVEFERHVAAEIAREDSVEQARLRGPLGGFEGLDG